MLVIVTGTGALGGMPAAAATPRLVTVAGRGGVGSLNAPSGIALDSSGDLFIADTDHCLVLLLPDRSGSMYGLRVQAGHPYTLAGGPTCGARRVIGFLTGVAVDQHGDVFIADPTGQRVFVVRPGGTQRPRAPIVFAGTGVAGYTGEGEAASESMLNEPTGMAVDAAGDLFIADSGNCRVRMVPSSDGTHEGQLMEADHLYTVAGTGTCGSSARGGAATSAGVDDPVAVAVDGTGDLFIADRGDDDYSRFRSQLASTTAPPSVPTIWMSSSGWAGTGPTGPPGRHLRRRVEARRHPESARVPGRERTCPGLRGRPARSEERRRCAPGIEVDAVRNGWAHP